jgi:hypothetical protein
MKVPPLPVIKHTKVQYGVVDQAQVQVRNFEMLRESNFEHVKTPACPMERVGTMSPVEWRQVGCRIPSTSRAVDAGFIPNKITFAAECMEIQPIDRDRRLSSTRLLCSPR